VLQTDGRLSNVDLAQRVHLSPSACLRRVKQLEESGVIAQYVALLEPKAVGQHGTSFTIINLETQPAMRWTPSSRRCATQPRDPRLLLRGRRQRLPDPLHLP
jgi:DNA-binding Lrp family transcriptional regulator